MPCPGTSKSAQAARPIQRENQPYNVALNRPSEKEERVKENNDVKVGSVCLHMLEGSDKFIPGQHIPSCSL